MGQVIIMDNTRYETLTTCPMKYYLSYVRNFAKKEKSPALIFGTAIHKALEKWYKTGSLWEACLSIDETFSEFAEEVEDGSYFNNSDDHRTSTRAKQVMTHYTERYREENFKIFEVNGEKLLETSFCIPLTKIGDYEILYYGIIDAVIEMDGEIFVMDHKTTYSLGGDFFDQFRINNQMPMYVLAVSKMLEKPVYGVLINAIGVLKTVNKFERRLISYDYYKIQEAKEDLLSIVEHQLIGYLEKNVFPRHKTSCISKYGKCAFYEVCSAPYQVRESVLKTRYVPRKIIITGEEGI
jgi:hypothetical protein